MNKLSTVNYEDVTIATINLLVELHQAKSFTLIHHVDAVVLIECKILSLSLCRLALAVILGAALVHAAIPAGSVLLGM